MLFGLKSRPCRQRCVSLPYIPPVRGTYRADPMWCAPFLLDNIIPPAAQGAGKILGLYGMCYLKHHFFALHNNRCTLTKNYGQHLYRCLIFFLSLSRCYAACYRSFCCLHWGACLGSIRRPKARPALRIPTFRIGVSRSVWCCATTRISICRPRLKHCRCGSPPRCAVAVRPPRVIIPRGILPRAIRTSISAKNTEDQLVCTPP